jgi:hemoglobin
MATQPTVFEQAGGEAPFQRLIDGFYARVEHEPLLRPMYPAGDLHKSKEHLLLFIIQYFGGPAQYHAQRGAPRLRLRHASFAIGQAERDAWVRHMLAALDEAGFPAQVLPAIRDYFERAATFLINAASGTTIDLQ